MKARQAMKVVPDSGAWAVVVPWRLGGPADREGFTHFRVSPLFRRRREATDWVAGDGGWRREYALGARCVRFRVVPV